MVSGVSHRTIVVLGQMRVARVLRVGHPSEKFAIFGSCPKVLVTCQHPGTDQSSPSYDCDIRFGSEQLEKAGEGEATLCGQNS